MTSTYRGGVTALALAGAAWSSGLSAQATDTSMTAHFVNVGQGLGVVLEFSCGLVMIDAGGQKQRDTDTLNKYLGRIFQRRPDLGRTVKTMFITHNHQDHMMSVHGVTTTYKVETLIENGWRKPEWTGYPPLDAVPAAQMPKTVKPKDSDIEAGVGLTSSQIDAVNCSGVDPEITLLSAQPRANPGWPVEAFDNPNNGSLVIRVQFGAASFLFTGDLEAPAIETMVDFHSGSDVLQTDVYQVGHHGAENGTTPSLLSALGPPKIAILASGVCNRRDGKTAWGHGHPRAKTVNLLESALTTTRPSTKRVYVATKQRAFSGSTVSKAIYASGWDGHITIEARQSGALSVSTSYNGPRRSCTIPES
jgi:competence protein ComEC